MKSNTQFYTVCLWEFRFRFHRAKSYSSYGYGGYGSGSGSGSGSTTLSMCRAVLIGRDFATPPPIFGSYTRAAIGSAKMDDISLWLPGRYTLLPVTNKQNKTSRPKPPSPLLTSNRARTCKLCKRLRSPGIDSSASLSPGRRYVK
jgi:hypothetical protein